MKAPGPAHHRIVVDTHVHVYPFYELDELLERLLDQAALHPNTHFVYCLTERASENAFEELRRRAGGALETCAVRFARGKAAVIFLQGFQYSTSEKLEVLALASAQRLPDGLPAADYVKIIRQRGSLAVLPWSPGKWTGVRKKAVVKLLEDPPAPFMLGDVAIRPSLLPRPALLTDAREEGMRIAYGSDPLPFSGEEHWIGLFGMETEGTFDIRYPASSFKRLMEDSSLIWRRSGERNPPGAALKRFVKANLAKRLPGLFPKPATKNQ